jgi:predicted glycosyltransferase
MFYCQHLLGMGHLVRSTEIVRALAKDFSVLFVTGGEIPDGFRFPQNAETLQLIPLKSSPDFSDLLLCDMSWDLEETKAIRRELLLRTFDKFQPDVLVSEFFPFGRKQFSFELLPLLSRARTRFPKTMIVSSIRDVLVNRENQAEHDARACRLANEFYDLVLVHGDERFQSLNETFSRTGDLKCPLVYTGYVVQESNGAKAASGPSAVQDSAKPTIVVSNGSGKCESGHRLLENALRAAALLEKQIPHQFHVFAGPLIQDNAYEALKTIAAGHGNVTLERYTPDLPGYLRHTDLSISMAGYNTIMDILSAGVRSLVYPVTGNKDDEQLARASKLASMRVLGVLGDDQLQPTKMAEEIVATLRNKPVRILFNGAGAANSAAAIKKALSRREQTFVGKIEIPAPPFMYAAGAGS